MYLYQQVFYFYLSIAYGVMVGLNHYFRQRNKNNDRVWISCAYLLVNLWYAGSARALKLFCNGPSGRVLRRVIPR